MICFQNSYRELNDFYGIPNEISNNKIIELYGLTIDEIIEKFITNNNLTEEKSSVLKKFYDISFNKLEVYNQSIDILKNLKLKNINITLISNYSEIIIKKFIDTLKINNYVTNFVFKDDIEYSKNYVNLHLSTIIKFGINIHDAISIENNINGVYNSSHVGLKTLSIK